MPSTPHQNGFRSSRNRRAIFAVAANPIPSNPPERLRMLPTMPMTSPCRLKHRAARVSTIDRSISLEEFRRRGASQAHLRRNPPADVTHGEGGRDAIGRAHDEHFIAHFDFIRVAETGGCQARRDRVELKQGDIGINRRGDDASSDPLAISEFNRQTVHGLDRVRCGQHLAVIRDQDSGRQAGRTENSLERVGCDGLLYCPDHYDRSFHSSRSVAELLSIYSSRSTSK